jgi:hypothetical protein
VRKWTWLSIHHHHYYVAVVVEEEGTHPATTISIAAAAAIMVLIEGNCYPFPWPCHLLPRFPFFFIHSFTQFLTSFIILLF